MKFETRLWIFMAVLALLSPLGLILPRLFNSGSAWGEWNVKELYNFTGYIPQGMARLSGFWKAPMSGYIIQGKESAAFYVLSALIGAAVIIFAALVIGKALSVKKK